MRNHKPVIYVVDDEASICRAVALLLKSHGYKVEIFSSAESFLAFKHLKLPSCVVLDIRLTNMSGLALQDAMAVRKLDIPIIFITGHGDIPMSVKAMKAGAIDFLPKPFTAKKLLNAITFALTKNVIQIKELAEISKINRLIKTLTPRELEVFRFVARRLMNKEIAQKRRTSLQTIKVHRGRVMRKMQAKTVTELILLAKKADINPSKN